MESTINPTFKNKLQKVLQLNLDSEDTLLAFNDLSSFYDNNTIDSRWNLCAQLEKRCITVNEEFLQAFSQIQKVNFLPNSIIAFKNAPAAWNSLIYHILNF